MFMRSPFPWSFPAQKSWLISSDEMARQGSIVDRANGKAAAFPEWLLNSSWEHKMGIRPAGFAGLPWEGLSYRGKPALRAPAVPTAAQGHSV
jgi:hypothetical protein